MLNILWRFCKHSLVFSLLVQGVMKKAKPSRIEIPFQKKVGARLLQIKAKPFQIQILPQGSLGV